mgnify:CR=1 FL=1
MKILIIGGNFYNKGAQAMTYITCSEFRRKYPDCEIVMADACTTGDEDNSNLRFTRTQDNMLIHMLYGGNLLERSLAECLLRLKEMKNGKSFGWREFGRALQGTDCIIDVSGYTLGSNLPMTINFTFFYELKMAYKQNIPIILMPQSFGPFDFKNVRERIMDHYLKKYLKYPRLIYAREEKGYEQLQHRYGLTNMQLSKDMVLQSKRIDYNKVLYDIDDIQTEKYPRNRVFIGIIPNSNLYKMENKETIDGYYIAIIQRLLKCRERVLLAYHSGSDRIICQRLKQYFHDEESVVYSDEEMDCFTFEKAAEQMKFMISSRYHSIILGYKHDTPAIILAWADKYSELAKTFDQSNYLFNVGKIINTQCILNALDQMIEHYVRESETIRIKCADIQKANCFDGVFSVLNGEGSE